MQYTDIPGWFDFGDVYKEQVENAKDGDIFVEIGSWFGRSAAFMGEQIKQSGKKIRFYAVDTFEGANGNQMQREELAKLKGTLYEEFCKNMQECGVADFVTVLRMPSIEAAKTFADKSLAFVFIDAGHWQYEVASDVAVWMPKMRYGRVIGGHDYAYPLGRNHFELSDVARAVHAAFGRDSIYLATPTTWLYRKPFPEMSHYIFAWEEGKAKGGFLDCRGVASNDECSLGILRDCADGNRAHIIDTRESKLIQVDYEKKDGKWIPTTSTSFDVTGLEV